jgi:hypothetical protein
MKRKIFNLLIVLALVLSLSTAVSAQDSGLRPAQQTVTITSTASGYVGEKDTRSANQPTLSALGAGELQPVSVIVTFNRSVDPDKLASITGGQVIHRYNKVFNDGSDGRLPG